MKKSKKMTEEIKKITHIVGSVSLSMTEEIEESFTRERERERESLSRAYLIARESRRISYPKSPISLPPVQPYCGWREAGVCARIRASCDSARERDRTRRFRFSPEVKTETEPKLRFS